MKNFIEAYRVTMGHEGGYGNDPTDAGGETYKGISRVYNPSWDGWKIIDGYKRNVDFPNVLVKDTKLEEKVLNFYKMKYFDPFCGDEMPAALAIEMFDTAVNMGVQRAVTFLQTSLNLLNRNQKLYPDMVVDGDFGATTRKCLQEYLKNDTVHLLLKFLNVLQGNHYIEYMKKSPTQEKYARGWFARVEIDKK